MQLKWRLIYKFAADLVYTNRCPCCNEFIKWNELVCEKCRKELIPDESGRCPKCHKLIDSCICSLGTEFDKVFFVTDYHGAAKQGIYSLKDSCGLNFAEYCGKELGRKILEEKYFHADYIIPVPMRKKKKYQRGYNQAEKIAEAIRDVTGVPLNKNIVYKNKKVKDFTQHSLGAKDRLENAEKIYKIKNVDLRGKNIIICDDVMTTGSTINTISRLLKENGAEKIYAAVAAVTNKRKEE